MLKKILLAAVFIGPIIAYSNVSEASQWGVGLPLGVVALALFIIITLLEKETALYDLEQGRRMSELEPPVSPRCQAGRQEIPSHT